MAIMTNNTDTIPYKDLSIQVNLNGLSFCILNQHTHTIEFLEHFYSEKQLNPLQVQDLLISKIDSIIALQEDFKNVTIIHENELSCLVPKALFNEEHLVDYLKFNAKILKTDYIVHEEVLADDSVNVYIPYVNINNTIFERYGEFIFNHHSTILIKQILNIEKHSSKAKMYANIGKTHFDIVVVQDGKLKLYNRFEYDTKEDFIYYVLFSAEQLQLNPEVFELIFIGDIDSKDELYQIAYKYIRFVFFSKRSDTFKFSDKAQPDTEYDDFVLIHSF